MTWILLAAYLGQTYYFGRHDSPQQCQAQVAIHKSACPLCRIDWRCEVSPLPDGVKGDANG